MEKCHRALHKFSMSACLLSCICGLSACAVSKATADSHVVSHSTAPTLSFSCTSTGQYWHGAPVFALVNSSDRTYNQLTISSWSGQFLPVLWMGIHQPQDIEHISQFVVPPFQVKPSEHLLFVAPTDALGHHEPFTVSWLANGLSHYENVNVSGPMS